jgi:beta-barrel assembly-enhancing protease
MMKAFFQFLLLLGAFFATWFLLSRINFTDRMEINEFSKDKEKKLGELLLESIKRQHDEIRHDSINIVVNDIMSRICEANKIKKGSMKVYVIENSEVNAFALPGDNLVILTGLIKYCKTPEELAGVMAHEISHIQKDHVMKKLVKEVGIAMLFVIVGGNSSFEIISEVLKTVSSRAFDREQETEADLHAVKLLSKAKIDPRGLSDFLFRLSQESEDMPEEFVIISTHPGSADRSVAILNDIKNLKEKPQPLKYEYWKNR